jgi:hypothetical protein
MKFLLAAFGILIGSMSAWGIMRPRNLIEIVIDVWRKPWGMAFAIGVRLILGMACLLAAESTMFPMFYRVLGYLALASALALPALGRDRVDRLISYFQDRSDNAIRGWLAIGLALGAFLIIGAI